MGLIMPAAPNGIGVHTWMATASHGSSIGTKAAVASAKVLTLMGIDLLLDSEFLQLVKKDFLKRTEGVVYKSPINPAIKEPVGLSASMRSYESTLELKNSLYKQAGDDQFSPTKEK